MAVSLKKSALSLFIINLLINYKILALGSSDLNFIQQNPIPASIIGSVIASGETDWLYVYGAGSNQGIGTINVVLNYSKNPCPANTIVNARAAIKQVMGWGNGKLNSFYMGVVDISPWIQLSSTTGQFILKVYGWEYHSDGGSNGPNVGISYILYCQPISI